MHSHTVCTVVVVVVFVNDWPEFYIIHNIYTHALLHSHTLKRLHTPNAHTRKSAKPIHDRGVFVGRLAAERWLWHGVRGKCTLCTHSNNTFYLQNIIHDRGNLVCYAKSKRSNNAQNKQKLSPQKTCAPLVCVLFCVRVCCSMCADGQSIWLYSLHTRSQ